jgi:asparagine synthase (glutamine-hydrolysing)
MTRGTLGSLKDRLLQSLAETVLPALLRYSDRNSMAFSIETRVPFLTPKLAELAYSMPERYLVSPDGTTKNVFRAAMSGLVPEAVLSRREKVSFSTPEREWLGGMPDWIEETFRRSERRALPFLDLPALRESVPKLIAGSRQGDFQLWRCLNLLSWAETFDIAFES